MEASAGTTEKVVEVFAHVMRALGRALYPIGEERVIITLPEGLMIGELIGTWVKGPDAGKALVGLGAHQYRSFPVELVTIIRRRKPELH